MILIRLLPLYTRIQKYQSLRRSMEKTLTLIALYSCVVFFLTTLVSILLERKQVQVLTQQMRKFLKGSPSSLKYQNLSLIYGKSPKLKILTWTKSYPSWIVIVDYVRVLTFMVLLAVVSVLVVN